MNANANNPASTQADSLASAYRQTVAPRIALVLAALLALTACKRSSEEPHAEAEAAHDQRPPSAYAEDNAGAATEPSAPTRRDSLTPPDIETADLPLLQASGAALDIELPRGDARNPLGTSCVGFYAENPHARIEIEEEQDVLLSFSDNDRRDSTLALLRCDDETCSDLQCDDDSGGEGQPQLAATLQPGTWLVYVGSYTPRRQLSGQLQLLEAPPLNPLCGETITLQAGQRITREGNLSEALYSCLWHPGIANCRGFMPESPQLCVQTESVGTLVGEVVSAQFDTVLAIIAGENLQGATRFNDDRAQSTLSTTTINTEPGTIYAMMLGSYRRNGTGAWRLDVRLDAPSETNTDESQTAAEHEGEHDHNGQSEEDAP